MRAIDADELMTWFNDHYDFEEFSVGYISNLIKDAPTIEPPHGRWLKEDRNHVEYTAVCSECGYSTYWSDAKDFRFCPNCGARMTKGEEDE